MSEADNFKKTVRTERHSRGNFMQWGYFSGQSRQNAPQKSRSCEVFEYKN